MQLEKKIFVGEKKIVDKKVIGKKFVVKKTNLLFALRLVGEFPQRVHKPGFGLFQLGGQFVHTGAKVAVLASQQTVAGHRAPKIKFNLNKHTII